MATVQMTTAAAENHATRDEFEESIARLRRVVPPSAKDALFSSCVNPVDRVLTLSIAFDSVCSFKVLLFARSVFCFSAFRRQNRRLHTVKTQDIAH